MSSKQVVSVKRLQSPLGVTYRAPGYQNTWPSSRWCDLSQRAVESRAFIRFVEQFDRMTNSQRDSGQTGTGGDLHVASGVACRQDARSRMFDVSEFLFQDLRRQFRFEQVVNSSAAAADIAAAQECEIQMRNGPEHLQRFIRRVLPVKQMARRIVSCALESYRRAIAKA